MKFNYALLLIPLAQSAPLISEVGDIVKGLYGEGGPYGGVFDAIPLFGPIISNVVGPFTSGIPIVGPAIAGVKDDPKSQPQAQAQAQPQQQQQFDYYNYPMQQQQQFGYYNYPMQQQQQFDYYNYPM